MEGSEHPDPTGPEPPEGGAAAAHNGEVGETDELHDALTGNGEEAPEEPPAPPMEADRQLNLRSIGLKVKPTMKVTLKSGTRDIAGILEPEEDHLLAVQVRPGGIYTDFQHEANSAKIKGATGSLKLEPLRITRIPREFEAIVQALEEVPAEMRAQIARDMEFELAKAVPSLRHLEAVA
jgi:hypothetical protein